MKINSNYARNLFGMCALLLTMGGQAASDPSSSQAAPSNPPAQSPPGGRWFASVDGGYAQQFQASLDEGGAFEINRFAVRANVGYEPDSLKSLGFGIGYDRNHYHFSGRTGFGGADPWDAVNTIRIGMPVRYGFNETWSVFASPTIRWQAEEGADWSKSMIGGGALGLAYRFNDKLTLGPGFGVLTQLEDSPTYYPILLIRWNVAGRWWISTDEGLGATQGPGMSLRYVASDQWAFLFGGRYERLRFRLAESGPNADGVGEDRGVPIYFGSTFRWHRERSVTLFAGVKMGGELTLDNEGGHKIADTDYDPAPFLGLACDLRF